MREMKDSGIPWIGEIPKDWNCSKTKFFTRISSGDGISNEELQDGGEYEVLGGGSGIMGYHNNYNIDGDNLIIGRVGACGYVKRTNGKRYVSDNALIMRITSNTLLFNYLYYVLTSAELSRLNTSTAQPLITATKVYNVSIPLPSLAEQQRIAEFLDRKCADVDEMIALQEQIIGELKAYKQSVITEAVTKGLNPDVPMKDSGIEWIGSIPEHWIYTKLKYLCSFHNGDRSKNYPCPDEFVDKGVPFYGADSLNDFVANVNYARFITEEKYNLMGGLKIIEGDILYTLRGSTIGKNAIVQQPNGTTASSLMGIRRKDALTNAMYLLYWLHSQNEYIQRDICINGATAPNLSAEDVKEFMLFLPPISEQQAIADYLDEKCADIDSLIQTKQSKIDSLKEYKKSIIYEYVTGKKEVTE